MSKLPVDNKHDEKDGAAAASPLDGLEPSADPADPMILEIVERMVEMRRRRQAERRPLRAGKKTSRNRPAP